MEMPTNNLKVNAMDEGKWTDYEEEDLSYEMVEITPNFCDEHSY